MGLFTSLLSNANNNEIAENEYLIGEFSWESWKQNSGWSESDTEDYIPDELILEKLKEKLTKQNIGFLFYVAEWCGDSRSAAPIIMKLLELCGIADNHIKLIGVSRDKILPEKAFINGIQSLPTLQVLYDEYEIGRIEEYPAVSWEIDLLNILSDF